MSAKMKDQLTTKEIIAAASLAYENLNTHGWGEVYIIFLDEDRTTQAIMYIAPSDDEELDEAADECFEEVSEAIQMGWRPICLQVIPYAESIVVPLREDLTVDDQAVIWELSGEEEEEENGTGLEADTGV